MLSEVKSMCLLFFFLRCLVSLLVVVVLFEFCRLIIRIGVGGLLIFRVSGFLVLFVSICFSLL